MPRYSEAEREKMLQSTRKQLMDAAVEEFSRKGYAEANINTISEAAGFAKGTIYNYFPSKQDLLLALIDESAQEHYAYIAQAVRQERPPDRRLERFFEAGFAFVQENPAKARLLISTLFGPETAFRTRMGEAYLPMFKLVSGEILEPGMAQSVFRYENLMAATSLLMTFYLGSCSQVDESGKPFIQPQQAARFALEALRKRD